MTQVDAFETLADPTRRRILATLKQGELPVGDIVEQAGVHQSGVSRHLRILNEAGFVSVRPEAARRALYALRPEPFDALEPGSPNTGGCGRRASTARRRARAERLTRTKGEPGNDCQTQTAPGRGGRRA